jgi:hypothetical protein
MVTVRRTSSSFGLVEECDSMYYIISFNFDKILSLDRIVYCNFYYPANIRPSINIINFNTTKILSSSIYSIFSTHIGPPPALHNLHKSIYAYTNHVASASFISFWR